MPEWIARLDCTSEALENSLVLSELEEDELSELEEDKNCKSESSSLAEAVRSSLDRFWMYCILPKVC